MTQLRRWYFTTSLDGCTSLGDLMKACVVSARRNTELQPVCIHAGLTPDMRDFLQAHEVEMVERHVPFIDRQGDALFGFEGWNRNVASGTYLRTLVPVVEENEEYVLYTDVDTFFLRHPTLPEKLPRFLAAAPEHDPSNWSYFNAGVMIMNVPNMRAVHADFEAFIEARIRNRIFCAYEQGDLNGFYWMRWGGLRLEHNWKPYWGVNPDAEIVHFHGAKPWEAEAYLTTGQSQDWVRQMVTRNPEGYEYFIAKYKEYTRPLTDAPSAREVVAGEHETLPAAPEPAHAEELPPAREPPLEEVDESGPPIERIRRSAPQFVDIAFPGDYWAALDPSPAHEPEPWVFGDEEEVLWLIQRVRPRSIIEVGSWTGRSANYFAEACRSQGLAPLIVCVDTFLGSTEHWTIPDFRKALDRKNGRPTLLEHLQANTIARGNTDMVFPFPIDSVSGSHVMRETGFRADLIFIDAAHGYETVKTDVLSYWPLVSERGAMFGADYQYGPLARAVHECASQVGAQVLTAGRYWLLADQRFLKTADAPKGPFKLT